MHAVQDPIARSESAARPVVLFGPYGRTVDSYRPDNTDLAGARGGRKVHGPHLRRARGQFSRNKTGIVGISRSTKNADGKSYIHVCLGKSNRKFCIDTLGESEALRRAIVLRRSHLIQLALANAAILAARAAHAS